MASKSDPSSTADETKVSLSSQSRTSTGAAATSAPSPPPAASGNSQSGPVASVKKEDSTSPSTGSSVSIHQQRRTEDLKSFWRSQAGQAQIARAMQGLPFEALDRTVLSFFKEADRKGDTSTGSEGDPKVKEEDDS